MNWMNFQKNITFNMKTFKDFLLEELSLTKANDSGYHFETGVQVTFPFLHNTEKSLYFGQRFQQDIEPYGTYMILDNNPKADANPGWEKGKITFQNPLVIPLNTNPDGPIYNNKSWKYVLYQKYNKKGKSLTQALKKDGYDAIITVDMKDHTTSEIVKLL